MRKRFLGSVLVPTLALVLAACGGGEEPIPWEPTSTWAVSTPQGRSSDYFSWPWPDDRRLIDFGFLPTDDFPNPHNGTLFGTMIESADRLSRGWGLSAPIYLPFTGPIWLDSLPQSAEASLADDASIFLVAIDDSEARGTRVPLEWWWSGDGDSFLPGNVLAARPVIGFPLRPNTRYALVVTSRVLDVEGEPVGPDEGFFRAILDSEDGAGLRAGASLPSPFEIARRHFQPLADWLDDAGISPLEVAGAAVFTTQDVLGELVTLRDFIESRPRPRIENVRQVGSRASHVRYHASYDAPYFLHGKAPYEYEGGDIRYDEASGDPIVAKTETMRLSICIPQGTMPDDGWPVVFVSHGTGGNFESQFGDSTCELLSSQGIASFGIDQMIHGPRAEGGKSCHGAQVEGCFLNVVNAVAGRNVLRHSALDHISLRRAVERGIDFGDDTKLDLSRFGFFGHSQGGLTGSLYLALDPHVAGGLLSATGGHLTTTLLVRDEGFFKDLAESALFLDLPEGEELHQFHPALALVQTLAEVTDPLNYGRYWFQEAEGTPKSVFLTSGWEDEMTPFETTIAQALAAGVPQQYGGHTETPEFALADLEPVSGTIRGNRPAGEQTVTAALRQFPGEGHFPIFYNSSARTQMGRFFRTLVTEELPEIPVP